jgi:hypothetical protein
MQCCEFTQFGDSRGPDTILGALLEEFCADHQTISTVEHAGHFSFSFSFVFAGGPVPICLAYYSTRVAAGSMNLTEHTVLRTRVLCL